MVNAEEKANDLYTFFSNKLMFQIKDNAVVKSMAKSCALKVIKELKGVKTGACSHSKVEYLEHLEEVENIINLK